MIKLDLVVIKGHKDGSSYANQCDTHQINKTKDKKITSSPQQTQEKHLTNFNIIS